MSTTASPTSSDVVGHQGAQVDIAQRPAIAVNGWLGVLVLAACVAGTVVSAQDAKSLLSMASNLMVVLCGEQPASPVVNTGSLYT